MFSSTTRRSAAVQLALISENEVSPEDAGHVLTAAFTAKDYNRCVEDLNGREIDPQAYIDGLDRVGSRTLIFAGDTITFVLRQIIDTLSPGSKIYRRGLQALRKVCGIYVLLPSSYIKPEPPTLVVPGSMKRPFASGGFADVWKARDSDGCTFAVKQFRVYVVDNPERFKKAFCKDISVCKRINHENVLGIESVTPEQSEFCIVSKWMDNGDMPQYVKSHQEVNRMRLVIGITRGLHHLHSNCVVHGKLKGSNILIDQQGNPLLADFGLSSLTMHSISVNSSSPHVAEGWARWSAPELCGEFGKGKRQLHTAESDVYALSMVIVELYSGNIPFPDSSNHNVPFTVLRGERPPKPVSAEVLGLTPAVWELTTKCWHRKAAKRPNTSEILAHLEGGASSSLLQRVKGFVRDKFAAHNFVARQYSGDRPKTCTTQAKDLGVDRGGGQAHIP